MRAFVLSGGGNRGPLEVGAIQVLLENGILPDMIVGSSAGALNGALLAANPCLEQVQHMADYWREAGRRKTIRSSPLSMLFELLRGSAAMMDNRPVARYVRELIPPDRRLFGNLRIPLFVTIAHVRTNTLYVYGDDPTAPVADAIVASAAVPGFSPPTLHNGEIFVDGGAISNLPVCLAIARGATELWAIDLATSVHTLRTGANKQTALAILGLSIAPVLYNDTLRELESSLRTPGITLHHIPIYAYPDVTLGDFSRTESMLVEGAQVMREYLAQPQPNVIHYPPRHRSDELPPGPPGSRPFMV